MKLQPLLQKLQNQSHLSEDEMIAAMKEIMGGKCSDSEIAAFLMGLSVLGETPQELTGAAKVMRSKAKTITAPQGSVDCCGTGGDNSGSYNISTAVALVAAACGVPMAKHGNRSASSKSGAADVLEALGVNLELSTEKLEEALRIIGFAFLMAPRHHQAVKHVVPVRKALGVRTIFNLMGPLANPANTKYQLIGVFDRKWLVPMAQTLKGLGTVRAWVVHGSDGMDEITVSGKTYVAKLENGQISEDIITPQDFGLQQSDIGELKGGDAAYNAKALRNLLAGEKNAYRDIVIANTASVLVISGKVAKGSLRKAAEMAADAIDSKKAAALLDRYIKFSQNVK